MVCLPMKRSREDQHEFDSTITRTANYLMLLSREALGAGSYNVDSGRVFECKSCNRKFSSFQALGGHRASHKKPRLANGETEGCHDDNVPSKPKSHKCAICGVEFAIGQALGGHMRRHRAVVAAEDQNPLAMTVIDLSSPMVKKVNSRRVFSLDLNLTPLENGFGFRVDDEKVTPITVDFFL